MTAGTFPTFAIFLFFKALMMVDLPTFGTPIINILRGLTEVPLWGANFSQFNNTCLTSFVFFADKLIAFVFG